MLTGHSKAIIAVNSIFPFLAVLTVVLRLYARKLKSLTLKANDYAILLALVFTIANSMPFIYCATNGGMGQHIKSLSTAEIVVFGKVTYWTQFPYIFAVSLVKISILLFYRSVFTTARFRKIVNVLGGVVLLWTISFFFASVFQAWPISRNWYPEIQGTMIDEFAMYLALACTELILDVATLALPWTVIWKLHMKTSRKWMVSGIFTLGGFVCVSSAFRIYYFNTTHTSASEDFTYDTYNIFIWTAIEPCMGVICACLPTLGPLFQGGHSTESLVGSIRSYIQLRTSNTRSKGSFPNNHADEAPKRSGGSSTKPFREIPEDTITLTSTQGVEPNHTREQIASARIEVRSWDKKKDGRYGVEIATIS